MNDPDQALSFVYLVGVLVLVTSALLVRRIPLGQGLKMFAGWVLIFLAAFVAFTLKDDFMALGKRVLAEARGEGEVVAAGRELRIRKALDGHFWVNGELNGHKVRFLVDSGATVTTIGRETAERADIATRGFGVLVDTANGTTMVDRGRAARIKVGPIERSDFAVHVARDDTINVIGMNFLSTLSRWSVEGRTLVLGS